MKEDSPEWQWFILFWRLLVTLSWCDDKLRNVREILTSRAPQGKCYLIFRKGQAADIFKTELLTSQQFARIKKSMHFCTYFSKAIPFCRALLGWISRVWCLLCQMCVFWNGTHTIKIAFTYTHLGSTWWKLLQHPPACLWCCAGNLYCCWTAGSYRHREQQQKKHKWGKEKIRDSLQTIL